MSYSASLLINVSILYARCLVSLSSYTFHRMAKYVTSCRPPPSPHTLPMSVIWLKSERNEKMLLVWLRNLSSICRIRNRIRCKRCQCAECCFCKIYVPDSSGSRRTGSSLCDVCGTDNAGVKMGKECPLQFKCPHGLGNACCYFDHVSLTRAYFWSVVSLFQFRFSFH